jgi:hypothetical protein
MEIEPVVKLNTLARAIQDSATAQTHTQTSTIHTPPFRSTLSIMRDHSTPRQNSELHRRIDGWDPVATRDGAEGGRLYRTGGDTQKGLKLVH